MVCGCGAFFFQRFFLAMTSPNYGDHDGNRTRADFLDREASFQLDDVTEIFRPIVLTGPVTNNRVLDSHFRFALAQ